VADADRRYEAVLDMRFTGQAFELAVPVAPEVAELAEIEAGFRAVYAARYGAAPAGTAEVVSYRIAAFGRTEKPRLPRIDPAGRDLAAARLGTRPVGFGGATVPMAVLARDRLPPGQALPGPALVEEAGSCTVVPPGWRLTLLPEDVLVLEKA
jgi:N-methylhydantoinase A